MSIAEKLQKVNERIASACARANRPRGDVKLLAVSKLQAIEKIREAYACGQRDFAENYAQEALLKLEQLEDLADLRWHFIGRIQSNKAKLLPGNFELIHSVERAEIADIFNRQELDQPQKILLQFNVANETSKGGADEAELKKTLESCLQHENIRVCGLMVMPPLSAEAALVRPYFARAREFLHELRGMVSAELLTKHPLTELSMGTSQDFEVAIEEGATWIRLGTDVFGPRPQEENV